MSEGAHPPWKAESRHASKQERRGEVLKHLSLTKLTLFTLIHYNYGN